MTLAATTSPQLFPEILGYTPTEQLYLGSRTAVYRAVATATQQSVVIKVLRSEYPSLDELVQFRNQYAITKNLTIPGIIQPLSLESCGNSYALVMEDWHGIALGTYLQQQPLTLAESLAIALQLADVLHDLGQHQVVHKDIKPANILIQPESKQVKLIDFSIASLLPKETPAIPSANTIEGTLAYLAPEQTGRMNRGIDYRTDFYGLGVTLYQLLTGQLPFESTDPLELVHCHIAKQPLPVHQVNPTIPGMLAAIVSKLMAKTAEDRYQSALGLKSDLARCLAEWKTRGDISEFELGQNDFHARFLIPETLYGRDSEVQTLLAAFDRVAAPPENPGARGSSELVLVAGSSGIGKTAVVNEVHKPIVRQRGYFIKGKFDQFNRNIPLSAFVQALRALMRQLLSESDQHLQNWKTQILQAVGDNGQVLIEVIPELAQIIGQQPIAPELSGTAAQNRFNVLFHKFIEVFATAHHPLVIFLDDLQWADSTSLQLMQLLMSGTGHLLVLGAYRDNEVSPAHPFILAVEALRNQQVAISTITLLPLALQDTNRLVADTLHYSLERSQALTELIDRKTKGNPFFTTQFLKTLHEEGYIYFDRENHHWECNITQIKTLSLTDDVVEFMALQLQKLPVTAQQVLKLAACIGNQFDLVTLAIASEQTPTETAIAFWEALREGLILPTDQAYKFFQAQDPADSPSNANPVYRFLHDRVQQAAYALIPEQEQQTTHLKIGRLLWQSQAIDDRLFDILSHLNRCHPLIDEPQERQALIQLNLTACRRAKLATAYGAAAQYASAAIDLLPDHPWQAASELTLDLHQEYAEVAYLNTEFDLAGQQIQIIWANAYSVVDCIKSYELMVQIYIAKDQQLQAIETGLEVLTKLGVSLVDRSDWRDNPPPLPDAQHLATQPEMTNPSYLAALRILIAITPPVHHVKPDLFPGVVLTMIDLCEREGYSGLTAYAYGIYGLFLDALLGDSETAHRSGQLSLDLLERFPAKDLRTKVNMLFAVFVCACKEAGQTTLSLLKQGIEAGLEVGDIEYVSYCMMAYFSNLFLVGQPLLEVERSRETYMSVLKQFKQEHCIEYSKIWLRVIDEMIGGETSEPAPSVAIQQHFEATHNHQCLFAWHLTQMIACYSLEDYLGAIEHGKAAIPSQDAAFGILLTAAHHFYYALALLAHCQTQGEFSAPDALEQVAIYQDKLQTLAKHAPVNYLHKYHLVEAERQKCLGNYAMAIDDYDRAIAGATANGYLQEAALANELAAKFYLAWGKEKVAAVYLQDAYYGYVHWGATAKNKDLEWRYPHLLRPILEKAPQFSLIDPLATIAESNHSVHASAPTNGSSISTVHSTVHSTLHDNLDFAAILKASHSLSRTILLDDLLHQLSQIILQNSGAERCALILPNAEAELEVRAIATTEGTQLHHNPLQNNPDVPTKLIHYVKNTLETVIIDDCKTNLPVIGEYLSQHCPKSILCLPVLNQGYLIGILYLENQLARGIFTSNRLLVLNCLCTQAAISLENARLYQIQHQSELKFRAFVEDVNDLIYSITLDSRFTYLSPQFETMFGYPVNDYLNQSFAPLVHPEDLVKVIAFNQHLIETGEKQAGLEFRAKHQNGSWIWITCNNSPIKDEQANVIGFRGIARDISDRKQAEAALVESEAYHRNLFDQSSIGLALCSMTGQLLYVNTAYANIIGRTPEETLSLSYWEVTPEQYADAEQLQLESLQTTGRYGPYEKEYIHKNGQRVPVRLSGVVVERHGQQFIWSSVEDISDRKAAEAIIQQKNYALEQALMQVQQSQAQVVQSEKMSALGNLVAGVAHEINNPLSFLNGSINNAKDYIQNLLGHLKLYQQHYPNAVVSVQDNAEDIDLDFICEDLPTLLNSMQRATDRIKDISTSLRTFSRADTEYKVSANLHDGLDSTILILKYRLKANEYRPAIAVIQEYGHLPLVDCFPGQLNQVFMNILANAIDLFDEMAQSHSFAELEANPQQITIRTALVDQRVQISIRDNGRGMTDEVKARIFDHLFTTKAVGQGTGLGLAIARQIVEEKHGGTIVCHSTPGVGTEFVIEIP